MNGDMLIGFAIGAFTAFLIVGIFFKTLFWKQEEVIEKMKAVNRKQSETIQHLHQLTDPIEWANDTDIAMSILERKEVRKEMKDRLYERHENLVVPGTETILIETQGDVPDLPPGWRGKVER